MITSTGFRMLVALAFLAGADVAVSQEPAPPQPPPDDGGATVRSLNTGYGPLRLGSQSPYQSVRYGIDPRTPSTLMKDEWEVHVSESWSNTFVYDTDHSILLDYEMLDTRLSLAYGVTQALSLEFEWENRILFGGVMDRFINAFHRTFGLTDAGRHNFPRNQIQIQVPDDKGNPATNIDSSFSTNSLILTTEYMWTPGSETWPAFSTAISLRANLDNHLDISGRMPVEPLISISGSKSVWELYFYATLAFGYFGTEHIGDIDLRSTQWSGVLATEWRFTSNMSLILQYLWSKGVAQGKGDFSQSSNEITLGWKWELAPKTVFEFGLIENIINFDNSPDFGVHLGLMFRF